VRQVPRLYRQKYKEDVVQVAIDETINFAEKLAAAIDALEPLIKVALKINLSSTSGNDKNLYKNYE
jgi:hypothetical protein